MATTLPANFQTELAKGVNAPHIIVELVADSGTIKYGFGTGGFDDVLPIIKSTSSLQNKLDPSQGFATRGNASFTITGRDNFKNLVRDTYLKHRVINFKVGFNAPGYAYADYAIFYSGDFFEWIRNGDDFTIKVADALSAHGTVKLPIPDDDSDLISVLKYQNANPVDICLDLTLLKADRTTDVSGVETLKVPVAQVDQTNAIAEKDFWVPSVKFERVLIEAESANTLLQEVQESAGLFFFHNGEKIDCKVFAPLKAGETVDTFTDTNNILRNSLTQNSGYLSNFFNRVLVYADYDESGEDGFRNYEVSKQAADAVSQGSTKWNEVTTKFIKSKWIHSRTYTQPSAISGVVIYHMSRANPVGSGTLDWNATNSTLQWTSPSGGIGAAVEITESGQFQLSDGNNSAYIRVAVTDFSLLSAEATQGETITVTALAGDNYAQTLANRTLRRFSNPVATIKWSTDLNDINNGTIFRKPGDFLNITTDEAFEQGENTWVAEQVVITSMRPDYLRQVIQFEATETKFSGSVYNSKVGFIHDSTTSPTDYDSATDAMKDYAYVCDTPALTVGTVANPAYVIW